MPPRPLSKRVRVRHTSGAEKEILRSRLKSLGSSWTRVNPYSEGEQVEPASFAPLPDVAAIPQEPPTVSVEEPPDVPAELSDANPEEE